MIHHFSPVVSTNEADLFRGIHTSNRSEVEQSNPLVQLHDVESADIKLARQFAGEMINVSGAEVKVFIRTDNGDYDKTWDSDPDPTYWNPVIMKAFFKPQPLEVELKKWGADTTNRIEIVFNHFELYDLYGSRMLRAGDVVQIPFNAANLSPKNYRIINATPSGNYKYTWMYLTCIADILTADITVRPEDDMLQTEIEEDSGGAYRETI